MLTCLLNQCCRPLNFLSVGAHTLNCDLAERRTRSTVVEWCGA